MVVATTIFVGRCDRGHAMAHLRTARRLGAAGRRGRAAARGPGGPAAPRRGPDPLRVLRPRDALRGTGADAAHDHARAGDERHAGPPLPRGAATGVLRPGA